MKIVLLLLLVFIPFFVKGQDCEYENLIGSSGVKIKSVISKTSLGKILIGKEKETIFFSYMPKLLYAVNTSQNITLKIDSVIFIFENLTKMAVAVKGMGTTPNTPQIIPQLSDCYVGGSLNLDQISTLKSNSVSALLFKGEKASSGGDFINEKNRVKLKNSFTCIK